MKGIDVSAWQGNIDWAKVKNQIDFAIIKLGNIGDNTKFWDDDRFERNYNECVRLGIPVGVYVYSYTNKISNIEACANETVKYLAGRKLQLPVYIDMEDAEIAVEGKDNLTQMIFKFNEIIEKAGYWAGVYANRNWFDNYLNKEEVKKRFTTWIAHYGTSQDKYKGEYDIMQYTSSGSIDGINGNVDMNNMYRDLISDIATKAVEKPVKNPVIEISNLAHKIGEKVTINGVYASSTSENKLTPAVTKGTITRIVEDARNPYLLNDGNIGWINNDCIVSAAKQPAVDNSIKVGDKVKVVDGAKSYKGFTLASFVYNTVYDVIEIKGDRAVIGKGKSVTTDIHINNLYK